jgi:hypothetical protein
VNTNDNTKINVSGTFIQKKVTNSRKKSCIYKAMLLPTKRILKFKPYHERNLLVVV